MCDLDIKNIFSMVLLNDPSKIISVSLDDIEKKIALSLPFKDEIHLTDSQFT